MSRLSYRAPGTDRRGVTLMEMLVVLILLGVMATLAGVNLRMLSHEERTRADSVEQARRRAIMTGEPVTIVLDSEPVRFLPDGRILGKGIDPLAGAVP